MSAGVSLTVAAVARLHLVGRYEHGGLRGWLARLVVRGAVYRVLWAVPLPLVVGLGVVALVALGAFRRRRGRAG